MAHGPEVAYSREGLEVYHHQPPIPNEISYQSHSPQYSQQLLSHKEADADELNAGVSQKKSPLICGVRRSTFWLAVILGVAVVAAAVDGGVGGSIAVQAARSKDASNSQPTGQTNASPVTVTDGAPSPTASSNVYAPLPPQDVLRIGNSCSVDTIQSFRRHNFSCQENTDSQGNDITGIIAYTLRACIGACSTYNIINGTPACKGVTLSEDLATLYSANLGANCWLKNKISSNLVESDTATLAVLQDDEGWIPQARGSFFLIIIIIIISRDRAGVRIRSSSTDGNYNSQLHKTFNLSFPPSTRPTPHPNPIEVRNLPNSPNPQL